MGISYTVGTVARTGAERATLVRRTYMLLSASVVVTMGGVAFALTQPALMAAVADHIFLSFLFVLAPLMGAQAMARRFPANLGMLFLFTFAEGVWLSPLLYIYGRTMPGVLSQAAILTGGAFGALTLYAFASRRDFSAWGGFFTVGVWVLLGTLLLNMFFHNPAADLWISAIGILVFAGLLVFRTWQLRNVFGPDQYIEATLGLYLALLNMFLFMLNLLGGGRRR